MKKPLFEQIYETYKKYIIVGIYKPGDKLPSIREVANSLGINANTVNRGFLMLEEEGFVETIFKKGSFVKEFNEETKLLKTITQDIQNYKNLKVNINTLINIIEKVYGDDSD